MAYSSRALGALNFDSRLTQLPIAFDLRAVEGMFERRFGDGVSVHAEKMQDIKYQPGVNCVSTYDLMVKASGLSPQRTIGVLELGPGGAELSLFNEDPELVWLDEALDPRAMRLRFEQESTVGMTVAGVPRIIPLRYKPRLRCALRYDVPTTSGSVVVFAKMLAREADSAMSTLTALHQQSQDNPEMPRIAPPLAYWPDIHLVAQRAVEGGQELHAVAFSEAIGADVRNRWMRAAGENLACFHGAAAAPGPTRTWMEDLEELWGYLPTITAADPRLAGEFSTQLDGLRSRASPDALDVASHGAFRTDQFMVQGDRLVMIDLDGYCWADPARDIGNLFAYLNWKALRQPQHSAFIDRARDSFLEGYATKKAVPPQHAIGLFEAASMLKIAGRRYRSLTVGEWPLAARLVDSARSLLSQ